MAVWFAGRTGGVKWSEFEVILFGFVKLLLNGLQRVTSVVVFVQPVLVTMTLPGRLAACLQWPLLAVWRAVHHLRFAGALQLVHTLLGVFQRCLPW